MSRRLYEWKQPRRVLAASLAGALTFGVASAAAQESDTVRPASIHLGSCDSPGEAVAELNDLVVMFDDDDDDQGGGSDAGTTTSTPSTGDDNADDGLGGDDNADDGAGDDDADDGDDGDDDNGSRSGIRAFQSGGGSFVGPEDASVVEGFEDSNIGTDLATLLAEPHIVAVFEGEGSDTIIACGSIGGFASGDDDTDLAVGLRQQNGSGFAGIALFDDDDDDSELDVDVYIARDVATAG